MTIDVLLARVADVRPPKSRIIQRAQKWLHKKPLPSLEPVDIGGELLALAVHDFCDSDECASPSTGDLDIENVDALAHEIPVHRIMLPSDVPLEHPSLIKNQVLHINDIPVEILGEIFLYCLPTDFYGIPHGRAAPMLLCRICAYWREVALGMPRLWSSVSFYRALHRRAHKSLLELWLNRSDAYPLSLRLTLSTQFDEPAQIAKDVLSLYMGHATRWKHVSLELDDSLSEQLLSLPAGNLSNLEGISLDLRRCDTLLIKRLAEALYLCPRVHQLALRATSGSILTCMPWGRLTHVNLTCLLSLKEGIEILLRCLQIEDFTLRRLKPSSVPAPRERVTLPNLQSLHLLSNCDVGDFLDHFTFPVLCNLAIRHESMGTVFRNRQALEDLLARSSCHLQSFFVADATLFEDDLIGYLNIPSLGSLRRLVIHSRQITDRTLHALKASDNKDTFILPYLESLELKECSESTSDGVFATMVATRWKPFISLPKRTAQPFALRVVTPPFAPPRSSTYQGAPMTHERDRSELTKFSNLGLRVRYGIHFIDCEASWAAN